MKIRPEILAIISQATTDGRNLVLPPAQLDRKVYQEVAKIIDAAGGKWNKKAKALVFEGDAGEAIESILLTGEVTFAKQDFGQFDTPMELAHQVVDFAEIRPRMFVLEPSCGIGNLVLAIEEESGAIVEAFEVDAKRLHKAKERCVLSGGIRLSDFTQAKPLPVFDAVIMNPPFANRADILHVTHAAMFLKPGGRLTAIMSAGVAFRVDRMAADFRAFVDAREGTINPLPEGSFKSSGTDVGTVLVQFRG